MQTAERIIEQETPPIDALKAKMKATWEDGDYARFARYMEPGAIEILDGWALPAGQRLLDVGCGSGQSAIPAARRGLRVTGVDIAENLVEHARERARAEGLLARFDTGDAEALPYGDGTFDAAISMIGAMFAPRPERVASEFARVLRPGGTLCLANWTARGMPGRMFACVAGHVPPPPGAVPPVLWGDEETVLSRLGDDFTDVRLTRRNYPRWRYPMTASALVDFFRANFGPVKRAFAAIDEPSRAALHRELEAIFIEFGERDANGITISGGEYLDVVATRR